MTATALARKMKVQIETSTGVWTDMSGITSIDGIFPVQNLQDSTAYDNAGWTTQEPTSYAWTATITAMRRLTGGTSYDVAQEYCRAKGFGQFGDTNARVHVRIFDRNGGPEAFDGYAYVGYQRANNGVNDLDACTITLTGDGALTTITNPVTGSLVPTLVSANPTSGATTGSTVIIYGNLLTGAVSATMNAVAMTNIRVIDDNRVVATVPSGSAGPGNIIVTNGAGASAALTYTRGA